MNTAQVIAIVNQKGGVGKTTTAINLSAALAIAGSNVLVIDFDPQGNTSTGVGIRQQDRINNIYLVLISARPISECIMQTNIPNLSVVSSNTNLSAVELELAQLEDREYILLNILKSLTTLYDYIIIDCPPSLNLLTINALTAADKVLIPMQCDFYSLEGLSHLLKTIELIQKNLNPKIKIAGILFTMYDKRNRLTEQVEADVRGYLGDLVFDTTIPRNIRLSEAPSYGQPGILYDHRCAGSMAYIELTKEIFSQNLLL